MTISQDMFIKHVVIHVRMTIYHSLGKKVAIILSTCTFAAIYAITHIQFKGRKVIVSYFQLFKGSTVATATNKWQLPTSFNMHRDLTGLSNDISEDFGCFLSDKSRTNTPPKQWFFCSYEVPSATLSSEMIYNNILRLQLIFMEKKSKTPYKITNTIPVG